MTFSQFVSGVDAQRRYWARSHLGWQAMQLARPNDGHRALARLEASGALAGLITQNVDGLHTAAGSGRVVDLHGRIADVTCLGCKTVSSRADLHGRLHAMNPRFGDGLDVEVAPDGDAALASVAGFRVAACTGCGGVLKPDVVFFGETVPADRVAACFSLVDDARLLLVLGSSLTVMSGYRFVLHAARTGVPVAIVNSGVTRGDATAALLLDAPLGEALPALTDRLDSLTRR